MRKLISNGAKLLVMAMILMVSTTLSAQQKYGYIYSEKVFKSIPEYNNAIAQLEESAKQASEKGEEMIEEVKQEYSNYLRYRDNMSQSQRRTTEQALIAKEKAATGYEDKFFGEDGEMSKIQKQLMDPIEARVVEAVNAIAQEGGYDMIFDLSNVRATIYQSPKLDLTNMVIERLK